MRTAGIQARVKKKKSANDKDVAGGNAKVFSFQSPLEKAKYVNFWGAVESSMRIHGKGLRENEKKTLQNEYKKIEETNLFHPEHVYKIAWDVFVGVLIVFSIITVPFRISFELPTSFGFLVLDYLFDFFFFLDMCANANTALLDPVRDVVITDRRTILKEYFKMWFWVDFVSTIPVEVVVSATLGQHSAKLQSFRLFRIARLLRLVKLARFVKLNRLTVHLERFNGNPALLNVILLVFQIFFFAHLIACFWHFMTTIDVVSPGTPTWLDGIGLQDGSVTHKYIASFYWTFASMLAIGYGDIHAVNSKEMLYSVATMLCGGILFGAVIAQVTRLIETRNPHARMLKAKMTELKSYLSEKSLPSKLKMKCMEAYDYYLHKKSSLAEAGGILDELPNALSNKLIRNIYEKELIRVELFQSLDIAFSTYLLTRARPFQAVQGEVIYDVGDVAEDVVFLLSGLIRIEGQGRVIAGYATDGYYFGDFEFLTKSTRVARYTAASKCNFLAVSYSVLREAIFENPDAGEELVTQMRERNALFKMVSKLPTISEEYAKRRHQEIAVARASEVGPTGRNSYKAVKARRPRYKDATIATASSSEGVKVRSQLWVNGSLQAHETMEEDMINARSNVQNKDVLYRVLRLNNLKMRVIKEEPVSAMSSHYMLHPKGTRKNYWDLLVGALILYSVLLIPVQIGFEMQVSRSHQIFDNVVDGLFFVDILYCCRTAVYSEEEDAYVAIPSQVFALYFRSWFAIDFLSSIPFDQIVSAILDTRFKELKSIRLLKVVRITRLLKLARLLKLTKYKQLIEDHAGVSPIVFDLFRMISEVIFIGHLVACTWWAVTFNIGHEGWMANVNGINLRHQPVADQYVASVYFTFTTLTTTGYGDVTSTNTEERILNIIIMIVGATVFGYIVASVSSLMGNLNQAQAQKTEKLSELSGFLTEKNCPARLTGSIMRFVRHSQSRTSIHDEEGILYRLPLHLALAISYNDNREIMKKIPIFRYIKNKSVAMHIFRAMTPVYFDSDQFIIKEGEIPSAMYFIVGGTAKIYTQSKNGRKLSEIFRVEQEEMQELQENARVLSEGLFGTRVSSKSLSEYDVPSGRRKSVIKAGSGSALNSGSGKGSAIDDMLFLPRNDSTSQSIRRRMTEEKAEDAVVRLDFVKKTDVVDPELMGYETVQTVDDQQSIKNKNKRAMARAESASPKVLPPRVSPKVDSGLRENVGLRLMSGSSDRVASSSAASRRASLFNFPALFSFTNDADDGLSGDDDGINEDEKRWKPFSQLSNAELGQRGKHVVGEAGTGCFVGHAALMRHSRNGATVRAVTPCSVYALKKGEVVRLLRDQPSVAVILQMALGRAMHALGYNLGHIQARKTRANFLLRAKRSFMIKHFEADETSLKSMGQDAKLHSRLSILRMFSGAAQVFPTDVLPFSSKGEFGFRASGKYERVRVDSLQMNENPTTIKSQKSQNSHRSRKSNKSNRSNNKNGDQPTLSEMAISLHAAVVRAKARAAGLSEDEVAAASAAYRAEAAAAPVADAQVNRGEKLAEVMADGNRGMLLFRAAQLVTPAMKVNKILADDRLDYQSSSSEDDEVVEHANRRVLKQNRKALVVMGSSNLLEHVKSRSVNASSYVLRAQDRNSIHLITHPDLEAVEGHHHRILLRQRHRSHGDLQELRSVASIPCTTHDRLRRRQSFPSVDNKVWKKEKKSAAIV